MEMYGNILCVAYSELVSSVISKSNYKKKVREKKIIVVCGGGNGRRALIDYKALPDDIRIKYDAQNPQAKEQLKEQQMSDTLTYDSRAVQYYRDTYTLPDGSRLTDKRQAEYVLNAQVCNEMMQVESDTRALHSTCGYIRPQEVWGIVQGTCENLRVRYEHSLPTNARLREKYNNYKRDGYKALVSGKVGNQNTRKIGTAEARFLLRLKRSRVPVYTDMQIYEAYNRAVLEGKFGAEAKILKSPTSVRNFLYDTKITPLWWAIVYGELEWKHKFSALLKTELPSVRDAIWYSDGTKLNLYYKDDKNQMRTTSVYEVMDAYSEVFLGYDIAPGEKFDSQYRAFRMAVETTGVKPFEIVNDNQGGHKKLSTSGFFKKITNVHRFTTPYNGQSKSIESVFGRFQQQILRKLWYFVGQNITAKRMDSRPNLEFIEANPAALPTLEELKKVYAECRQEWNAAAHPATGMARKDMYESSFNPRAAAVGEADMRMMFWLRTAKPATYTNDGLKITINTKDYHYEVYASDGLRNERFALANTGGEFYTMYDPMDMTLVELWKQTADGLKWMAEATPKVTIRRSTQERTTEDTVYMRAQLESNKATRAAMMLKAEEFDLDEKIAAELFGLVNPNPKGISKKAMDEYREKYDSGKIDAPVNFPGQAAIETAVAVEVEEAYNDAIASAEYGQYQKAVSNLTYDEVRTLNKF